jgi:hypothetical protein
MAKQSALDHLLLSKKSHLIFSYSLNVETQPRALARRLG